jgi:ribose-phosphate pyrophosphokinase
MNERAKDELILFAGHSNPALASAVARDLGVGLGAAEVRTFSDGEILVEIDENVRGGDVFVLQSICTPGNDNLMQLLLMLDALKRASAKRITAVMPYYGYARQDRKVAPRVPISAKLIADLVTTAGASRVLTMDLHAGQIQGFFNIPVDNLYATPVLLPYIRERVAGDQVAVVSPDAGGVERARAVAKRLDAGLAIIVVGCSAILVDDIVDTAGTIVTAAAALREAGARRVIGCCTHGVLSGPAIERLKASDIEQLVVTDTIPLGAEAAQSGKVHVRSVAHLLAEAIRRTHDEESISSLFLS